MSKDVTFFIARDESLIGVQKYLDEVKRASKAQADFADEFDCLVVKTEESESGLRLAGLRFDNPPDSVLWRKYNKARDPNVYCPNRSTPEGAALGVRFDSLPSIPNHWQLFRYVMPLEDHKNQRVWDLDGKIVYPRCSLEKTDTGDWVIGVCHNSGTPPVVAPLGACRFTGELRGVI